MQASDVNGDMAQGSYKVRRGVEVVVAEIKEFRTTNDPLRAQGIKEYWWNQQLIEKVTGKGEKAKVEMEHHHALAVCAFNERYDVITRPQVLAQQEAALSPGAPGPHEHDEDGEETNLVITRPQAWSSTQVLGKRKANQDATASTGAGAVEDGEMEKLVPNIAGRGFPEEMCQHFMAKLKEGSSQANECADFYAAEVIKPQQTSIEEVTKSKSELDSKLEKLVDTHSKIASCSFRKVSWVGKRTMQETIGMDTEGCVTGEKTTRYKSKRCLSIGWANW